MSWSSGLYSGVVTHVRWKPRPHRLRYRIFMLLLDLEELPELDAAFRAVADLRPNAFFSLPDGMFYDNRRRIAEFAAQHRLPGVFPVREYAEAGGLLSYATSLAASWRRAAGFVDKILKGARPADLPVEQATTFELVINLKTARAFGRTIPPSVLARADHVIE